MAGVRMVRLLAGAAVAVAVGCGAGAGAARAADSIYWIGLASGVRVGDLDGTGAASTLFADGSRPQGVAIDPAAGKIYWTDTNAVWVGDLDGTGTPATLFTGEGSPDGVAVDPAAGKIYWADTASNAIRVGNLDGTGTPATLFTGDGTPQGVAIDPAAGKIYWTDQGSDVVRVGNLDGTGTPVTLFAGEGGPDGVAVDPAAHKIYWTDQGAGVVRVGNLNGTGAANLFEGESRPMGVAIDPTANKIYWTESTLGAVRVGNLDGTGTPSTLFAGEVLPLFPALLRAPVGTGVPVVSGGGQVGQPLACSPGSWAGDLPSALLYRAPAGLGYQWQRDATDVPGATAASYTPTAAGSYTCQVSATNHAGSTVQTSTAATVTAPPPTPTPTPPPPPPPPPTAPVNTRPPSITGARKAGRRLTCQVGAWTGSGDRFGYRWGRDRAAIPGASHSTYTVKKTDQGATLRCTVTASNSAGTSRATSDPVAIRVPDVPRCPAATGRLTRRRIGRLRLGMTRRQATRAMAHSSVHGDRSGQLFCLTPTGIRVRYATPHQLKTIRVSRRDAYRHRVIWISTANVHYAIHGVRAGQSLDRARQHLKLSKVFHIAHHDWYIAHAGPTTGVLEVRHHIVTEIAITDRALTRTRTAQHTLLHSLLTRHPRRRRGAGGGSVALAPSDGPPRAAASIERATGREGSSEKADASPSASAVGHRAGLRENPLDGCLCDRDHLRHASAPG